MDAQTSSRICRRWQRLQSSERSGAATIVTAQSPASIVCTEDGGVAERTVFLGSIGGDISPVAALREGNFEAAIG
jgi:hypothetical protein